MLLLIDPELPQRPPTHTVQLMTVKQPVLNPRMRTPQHLGRPRPREDALQKSQKSGWLVAAGAEAHVTRLLLPAGFSPKGRPLPPQTDGEQTQGSILQAQPSGAQPLTPLHRHRISLGYSQHGDTQRANILSYFTTRVTFTLLFPVDKAFPTPWESLGLWL